jgi:hypothetical protein
MTSHLGLVTEFLSKKIPRIDSERLPLFRGLRKSQFRSLERNRITWKLVSLKTCSSKQNWERVFVREMLRNGIPSCVFSSSEEWFGAEFFQVFASFFVTRNGIPICFLFRGMVQNGIQSVCFFMWRMKHKAQPGLQWSSGPCRSSGNNLWLDTPFTATG